MIMLISTKHKSHLTVYIIIDIILIFMFVAFNVGEYRRAATEAYRTHDFFRADNKEAQEVRQ